MKLRLVKSSDASKQYCFKNTGNSKTDLMLQNNVDASKQILPKQS